jgi:hypothetical protein
MPPELRDVPISAMIEQSLRDEIAELAKAGDRSFSAEVRRALRWYVLNEPAARQKGST